jgi:putative transcriptional regulator
MKLAYSAVNIIKKKSNLIKNLFVVLYCDNLNAQFLHIAPTMDKGDFSKKLGQNLKFEREKLSISQSELARICLKDRQYIHRIENGTITPTICNELNIDVSVLLKMD